MNIRVKETGTFKVSSFLNQDEKDLLSRVSPTHQNAFIKYLMMKGIEWENRSEALLYEAMEKFVGVFLSKEDFGNWLMNGKIRRDIYTPQIWRMEELKGRERYDCWTEAGECFYFRK